MELKSIIKKPAPPGCTVVSPYLLVESVESLMEFLVKVFNAVITNDTNRKDGFIQHGEVLIGDTTIMLGRSGNDWPARQSMNYIYVDNADETYQRALTNGATSIMLSADRPYGIREAGFTDKFGNQWWIAQVIKIAEPTEEQTLIQAELDSCLAIERNNVEEISRFIADDWAIVATDGGISPGAVFLNLVESGDLVHTKMDFEVIHARIYHNTGIVISKGTSAGTYKKNPFSYFEWSTSFFIREGNNWKTVLTMLTPAKS